VVLISDEMSVFFLQRVLRQPSIPQTFAKQIFVRHSSTAPLLSRHFPFNIDKGIYGLYTPQALQLHYQVYYGKTYNEAKKFLDTYGNSDLSLESIILQTSLEQKHYAGHLSVSEMWNHNFFWFCIKARHPPSVNFLNSIRNTYGSFKRFSFMLQSYCLGLHGGGWVWLMLDDGAVKITHTSHTSTPLTEKGKPILALDMHEHAYLYDYASDRETYVEALYKAIDWSFVERAMVAPPTETRFRDILNPVAPYLGRPAIPIPSSKVQPSPFYMEYDELDASFT
jgi:Fe-Mn family superoxide dismutase